MLLSLLLLILLAAAAYQTKRIVLPGLGFGVVKAVASYLLHLEAERSLALVSIDALGQFAANGALGIGIAYLVVKRAQDAKYAVATTVLAILTYITSLIDYGELL